MNSGKTGFLAGAGLAILAAFIWSGNFIIARGVHDRIPPISLAFYRWLVASLILFPFSLPYLKKEWPIVRRSAAYLFFVALSGVTLFNTLVYVGAHYTPAINLTLIGTTSSPIMATVMAYFFLREPIGWNKWAGLAICVCGVLFLLCQGNPGHLLSLHFSTGDLWVLSAACCFAVYNTLVKKKPAGLSPLHFLALIFAIGTLLLVPFFLYEKMHAPAVSWSARVTGSILYLGIGASAFCFWIWNLAITRIGASRTIIFGNLIPVFGTLGSILILGEKLYWFHMVSMLIVFAGILVANLRIRA